MRNLPLGQESTGNEVLRIGVRDALPGSDDLVHGWVGEERFIQLIMAPLPIAQQINNYILSELALIFKSKSCGSDHFLWTVSIDVDDGTAYWLPNITAV